MTRKVLCIDTGSWDLAYAMHMASTARPVTRDNHLGRAKQNTQIVSQPYLLREKTPFSK
jgi:hypothetical protein